ncbi:MAG TPA: hypothetical protein VMV59_09890, partial [Candidatus Dormibacteraeota bacterium]|nr:hypothetical protein [Candidatus Dormibacteraeota bacterium]
MKRAVRKPALNNHVFWMCLCVALVLPSVLSVNVLAQNQRASVEQRGEMGPAMRNSQARFVRPNYQLAARFVPSNMGKLVF